LLRAKVIACCFDASVAAGFDLAARGRFLPCMSTPVPNWGKLQAHGSLPTGGRMYLAELIFELSVDYIVLFDPLRDLLRDGGTTIRSSNSNRRACFSRKKKVKQHICNSLRGQGIPIKRQGDLTISDNQ
jgi:hypothetical protein